MAGGEHEEAIQRLDSLRGEGLDQRRGGSEQSVTVGFESGPLIFTIQDTEGIMIGAAGLEPE